jgi:putative ABC transport system permease protein
MRVIPLLQEAWLAIRSNRSRTALTILGIIIGVGSVISVVSIGEGAKEVIGDLLGEFGSTSILVMPNFPAIRESQGRFHFEEMTRRDVQMINETAQAVRAVTPQVRTEVELRRQQLKVQATLLGTMHQYLQASKLKLMYGRFLNEEDDLYLRKVGVLGFDLAHSLFGEDNPVGQFVAIPGVTEVEIIGVLEKEQKSFISTISDFDTSNNNTLFVPVGAMERVGGQSYIFLLIGEAVSADRVEEAKREIVAVLNANHGKWEGKIEKYLVQEMGQILKMIDTTTGTLTALISIIAGIALVVAGIGIMNIMLVSVKERTREIGVRKALGANQASILNQFLVETLVLCGGGGLLGVALAVGVVQLVSSLTSWPAMISASVVELAVILALATGLLFGLYPASKAARMDPVEALRYE